MRLGFRRLNVAKALRILTNSNGRIYFEYANPLYGTRTLAVQGSS
jgi:hypothetical protein